MSDTALADALTRRGHRVRHAAWNDAPLAEFTTADLVILRSNWDYHHSLSAFETWLDDVERSDVELRNPAELVRAYLDKAYLDHLVAAGFRTPRTLVAAELDGDDVLEWVDTNQLDRVVVKPAWGASGHGVELASRADLPEIGRRWRQSSTRRPMLVQEFIPEVAAGECALIFFRGEFSHALRRQPVEGEFRVNSQYGGTTTWWSDVDPSVVEFGRKVEATLPEVATYARIDVVPNSDGHVVMEVEINEPGLGLNLAPGAGERFADALLN
ncbi:MAG: hypothetical protein AAF962_09760 [Actinomycetota bacterium]